MARVGALSSPVRRMQHAQTGLRPSESNAEVIGVASPLPTPTGRTAAKRRLLAGGDANSSVWGAGAGLSELEDEGEAQWGDVCTTKFGSCMPPKEPDRYVVDKALIFPRASSSISGAVAAWRYRKQALVLYMLVCAVVWTVLWWYTLFSSSAVEGKPIMLTCWAQYWAGAQNCGLGGIDCLPLEGDEWLPFRCPSGCHAPLLSKQHHIWGGPQPGGGNATYTGHSRICKAAIHAGIIGTGGGCGLMREAGPVFDLAGSKSHGITSGNFFNQSWYPKAYQLAPSAGTRRCTSLGWGMVPVTVGMLAALPLLLAPRVVTFMSICVLGFWHCILHVDFGTDWGSIQQGLGDMLPFLSVSYFVWTAAGRHCMLPPAFPFDVVVLYIVPSFVLLHLDFFLAFVPDFAWSNEEGVSGGAVASMVLCSVAVVVAVGWQSRTLYRMGQARFFLTRGGALGALLVVLTAITWRNFDIHVHHYLVALGVLLVTQAPTRFCNVLQALFLGLFINGVARWGFDSLWLLKPGVAGWSRPYTTKIDAPLNFTIVATTNTTIKLSWLPPVTGVLPTGYTVEMNDFLVHQAAVTVQQPPLNRTGPGVRQNFTMGGLRPETLYLFCGRSLYGGTASSCAPWAGVYTRRGDQDGPQYNGSLPGKGIFAPMGEAFSPEDIDWDSAGLSG